MSKMKELSQVLDELVACGEGLINAAKALREMYSGAEPEQSQAKEPTPEPKKYTFAEVRKAFAAKSHAGFTAEVKALITSVGAERLSDVKEEDYATLMESLEALG